MFDIAIIGAGPAGATLARLVGDRYRVLLADRRHVLEPHTAGMLGKPCGGLLAPAAQQALARQGLGVPGDVIAGPQLFAVRTLDAVAQLDRLYQRFYINVDREAFDRWLVGLVPRSVEIVSGWSLTSLERGPDGSFLRFATRDGGSAGIRARLVVGADGAASLVRRLAFPGVPQPDSYVAIQGRFRAGSVEPYYGAIFDERTTDFYGWTIPKGSDVLAGVAVRRGPGALGAFERFVEVLAEQGFSLGGGIERHSAAISRPSRLGQLCPGDDDVVLLGEAAGFISPSSAEGISYALSSAAQLSAALGAGLAGVGARYRLACAPIAMRMGVKAAKSSAIYARMTRRLVMRSGLGAIATAKTGAALPSLAG